GSWVSSLGLRDRPLPATSPSTISCRASSTATRSGRTCVPCSRQAARHSRSCGVRAPRPIPRGATAGRTSSAPIAHFCACNTPVSSPAKIRWTAGGGYPAPTETAAAKDRPMRLATTSALAIALAASLPAAATAQNYPSRTVTVVVPFPAGGSVDGVARIMVQKLNETVGQHFIVENRAGGASGIVGANAVAKAAPD